MLIKQAGIYKSVRIAMLFISKRKSGIGLQRFYAYLLAYRFAKTVQFAYQLCACGRTYFFEPLLSHTELNKIAITTNRFTFVINDETGFS